MNDFAEQFMSEEEGREEVLTKAEAAAESEADTRCELFTNTGTCYIHNNHITWTACCGFSPEWERRKGRAKGNLSQWGVEKEKGWLFFFWLDPRERRKGWGLHRSIGEG